MCIYAYAIVPLLPFYMNSVAWGALGSRFLRGPLESKVDLGSIFEGFAPCMWAPILVHIRARILKHNLRVGGKMYLEQLTETKR